MRLRPVATAIALVCAVALGACGGGEQQPDSPNPGSEANKTSKSTETTEATEATETGATTGEQTVGVTVKDGTVTPAGERVEVRAGQPITFVIDSDVAGELHAHSAPEQSIEFTPGTTTQEITIDRPGVVDVELHEPATLVVQLEVR